ncbi:hypothetical protein [Dysgonomonas sp. 216]|uniref:hypothetical protein n=1 Tax=Dysgonomonas sp. 216 TaxID=2302934 RepID=UPI0013D689AC|nr:hypothetical protein [Dysgonomonas sp. 216]
MDTIIAFLSGGGLLTVITARATKRQAEAHAMKAVQEVYQETIKDLRTDKDKMREDNAEMREMVDKLEIRVREISIEVGKLKRYKCTVVGCAARRKD